MCTKLSIVFIEANMNKYTIADLDGLEVFSFSLEVINILQFGPAKWRDPLVYKTEIDMKYGAGIPPS